MGLHEPERGAEAALAIATCFLCRVWIPLKILQSVALWLVCKEAGDVRTAALPVALFGIHLCLGNLWNSKQGCPPGCPPDPELIQRRGPARCLPRLT